MRASAKPLSLSDLNRAATLVYGVLSPTAQHVSTKLSRRTGCTVWVKHENHTPTGAFKVRGGIVYIAGLRQHDPAVRGVISATRGNHGQSIAFAATRAHLSSTIYVPIGNSPDQNSAISAWGGKVVEFGIDFDAARQEAFRVAAAEQLHFIPSYHRDLVAGVATYALELWRAIPDLDAVYVGIGMGSGICGLISARDALGLKTEIIGVCASNASASLLSFAAGRPVTTPTALTFADGLATREPNAEAVAMICRGAARVIGVSEDAIAEAMRIYYDDAHQIAEGAGAAALAALLQEQDQQRGKKVAVILSGGNIERARYVQVLNGNTPKVAQR